MNSKVDAFLSRAKTWRNEFSHLRAILLDCGLTEELKWGKPCYTFEKSNIAIFQPFKEVCALMFFKGALLQDSQGILEPPGENSQAARRFRFTNVAEVLEREANIKAFVREAMAVEQAGLKVQFKPPTEFDIPAEFQQMLNENPALQTAFQGLTPGRQRGYLLHFSEAKQSKTRTSRVEKCLDRILAGKGLHD